MSEEKPKNIFQRINAVRRDVEYVKKDKAVSGAGANYKAVTHDQVVATVRASAVKHGVVIYPEQLQNSMPIMRDVKNDVKMHLYSGDYAVHFVNEDDPQDRLTLTINAHANDNGDKAPGKCVTYAVKTAVLKVFFLETGEDDEGRMEHTKPIAKIQADAIKKALGHDEKRILGFCEHYQIENVEALAKSEFDRAMAQIKHANQKAQQ